MKEQEISNEWQIIVETGTTNLSHAKEQWKHGAWLAGLTPTRDGFFEFQTLPTSTYA